MRNAPLVSLADIAESIRYGYTASASHTEVGPKFLRITDIVPPQIDWNTVPYCKIDEINLAKFSLVPGDIVIARTGATVGYAKLIRDNEPSVFASYLVRIRVDPNKAVPGYVGRIVESDTYKRFVLSRVGGAAQPNANAKVLASFRMSLPGRSVQNRIASILSAYDALIENNRRRIQLLEQAARLLYKEWFVQLRFPGHERVKVTDGVPEGWERKIYSAVFKFWGGFAFKSKTYQSEGKFGIVTIKNVHDAHFITECPSRLDNVPEKMKEHCVLNTGDILLSLTGNVGRACIVFGKNYLLNQRIAKVVGNSGIPRSFTYWTFSNETTQKDLANLAYGVAQLNLSPVKLGEREFLKPSPMVLELFGKIADPIFQQITTLNLEIVQLSQARNRLLPRLMRGEVGASVRTLEEYRRGLDVRSIGQR